MYFSAFGFMAALAGYLAYMFIGVALGLGIRVALEKAL
jgi:hypothetical protein